MTANPAGDWREESWTAEGTVEDFLEEFSGLGEPVRQLIGAATQTKRYAFYAREPVQRWVAGRVAILGDAAHPMLPFFAQGAGQAIEDGAVLAGCRAASRPGASRAHCGATRDCGESGRRASSACRTSAVSTTTCRTARRSGRETRRCARPIRSATTPGSTATTSRRICNGFVALLTRLRVEP